MDEFFVLMHDHKKFPKSTPPCKERRMDSKDTCTFKKKVNTGTGQKSKNVARTRSTRHKESNTETNTKYYKSGLGCRVCSAYNLHTIFIAQVAKNG